MIAVLFNKFCGSLQIDHLNDITIVLLWDLSFLFTKPWAGIALAAGHTGQMSFICRLFSVHLSQTHNTWNELPFSI